MDSEQNDKNIIGNTNNEEPKHNSNEVENKGMGIPSSAHESVQGRRFTMEDTYVSLDSLNNEMAKLISGSEGSKDTYAIYGVFDGHGGKDAAIICEQKVVINTLKEYNGVDNMEEALRLGFMKTDEEIIKRSKAEGWTNGSTGVLTVLKNNHELYIANLGDSEAVLAHKKHSNSNDGEKSNSNNEKSSEYDYILLTQKHKPSDATEKARIEKAGGHVLFGRVLGSLAVARAFGDIEFKFPANQADDHFVSAEPYVNMVKITEDNPFMIVSCDGLWDTFSYQDAVDFVVQTRANGKSINETVQLLVKEALDRGSYDNITTLLIFFDHQSSEAAIHRSHTTTS